MIHTIYANSTNNELVRDVESDLNATGREVELAQRLQRLGDWIEVRRKTSHPMTPDDIAMG